ncbi:MAG: polyprenyl synthetase family protein [Deltaproteobacteria bacterium]|nr:polyprenyl synthetase family protein [Deltaproteobacteria bacterium]
MSLLSYLSARRELVDKALDDMLPRVDNEFSLLCQAMRYSLFAGGKRIRPILAMEAAEVVGCDHKTVLPLAVALECIHTYSLIHDDLPAMDDDDLRRGKPTLHKVFGEALAILAGDALLTFAFEVMSSPVTVGFYRPGRLLAVIHELALASGAGRLIGGQFLDISSEGKPVDATTVESIVANKTAALIRSSLTCGALLAGGSAEEINILGRYGDNLGVVFQVKDDLLDLEGDRTELGKAVKKDQQRGKATFPRLLGRQGAREKMQAHINIAVDALRPLGDKSAVLAQMAVYIGERVN